MACVYVFPLPSCEPDFSLPSSDCVSFLSDFIVENAILFPHISWLCMPLNFGAVVGCFGVVLATIGPRMAQELFFPIQAVNRLFDCVYAVVGLRTCWSRDEGLVCLINLVRSGTTQTELEAGFLLHNP